MTYKIGTVLKCVSAFESPQLTHGYLYILLRDWTPNTVIVKGDTDKFVVANKAAFKLVLCP
jgi:hypothetical protein